MALQIKEPDKKVEEIKEDRASRLERLKKEYRKGKQLADNRDITFLRQYLRDTYGKDLIKREDDFFLMNKKITKGMREGNRSLADLVSEEELKGEYLVNMSAEGFNKFSNEHEKNFKSWTDGTPKERINLQHLFGLDLIGIDGERIANHGYIPKDVIKRLKPALIGTRTKSGGQSGVRVPSGYIDTIEDGVAISKGVYKYNYDKAASLSKEFNLPITPEQRRFLGFFGYNRGEGRLRDLMKRAAGSDTFSREDWLNSPLLSAGNYGSNSNYLKGYKDEDVRQNVLKQYSTGLKHAKQRLSMYNAVMDGKMVEWKQPVDLTQYRSEESTGTGQRFLVDESGEKILLD